MANADWYRNQIWTAEIEEAFFEKLRRARDKAQYLKIQAGILAPTEPTVALMLLEKFLELKEDFFLADALVAQANAYVALGKTEDAVRAFQNALERERIFPNLKTTAWSEFTLLVAHLKLRSHFEEALRVLDESRDNLLFPRSVFAWNAAFALIQVERGDHGLARGHAQKALAAARMKHSGIARHATAGLVGPEYSEIEDKLNNLVTAR